MSAYRVWCTDCYGCIHNTGPVKEPICSKCFKTSMDGMPSEYRQQRLTITTTTVGSEDGKGMKLAKDGIAFCPSCDTDDGVFIHDYDDPAGHRVQCDYCGLFADEGATDKEAVKNWNRMIKELEDGNVD